MVANRRRSRVSAERLLEIKQKLKEKRRRERLRIKKQHEKEAMRLYKKFREERRMVPWEQTAEQYFNTLDNPPTTMRKTEEASEEGELTFNNQTVPPGNIFWRRKLFLQECKSGKNLATIDVSIGIQCPDVSTYRIVASFSEGEEEEEEEEEERQ